MAKKKLATIEKLSLFTEEKPIVQSTASEKKKIAGFQSAADLLSRYQVKEQNKYISHEFQDYACHLAESLNDRKHLSLYIKLAKEQPRQLLARALSFVVDSKARSKAKLFMWKLQQLKKSSQTGSTEKASKTTDRKTKKNSV